LTYSKGFWRCPGEKDADKMRDGILSEVPKILLLLTKSLPDKVTLSPKENRQTVLLRIGGFLFRVSQLSPKCAKKICKRTNDKWKKIM
ncbi:MAG: hypothetical protein RR828_07375, partial [Oscillospiraceae bacterium]